MALFLFFVIVAMVLGLIGTMAHGLSYLLIVGVAVFVADLIFLAVHWSRRARRRPLR
ncbi:hypothetical protein [Streptomyces sp. Rer75]|uniref:hypothetical protein n=1 Tax=Streptomyces sp. Rer75 TaxID=2750011 RepID=UPI0015CFAFB8|nr:hypothetical protein [Streptomyces sp. Rer75]QLH22677.1 hypothetical protein HYQ63_20365 [Streptomyces sp. Rer75]